MILSRLKVLLAERNIKISKVSNDTGISRTTLTALAQNTPKGVQFETIDVLCQYLGIKISDFFEYVPFDIDINCEKPDLLDLTSKDNFQNFATTKVELSPFDMDLFLIKTSISKDLGAQKYTYDLTARVSEPISLITYEDDNLLKGSVSNVELLYGQSESNDLSAARTNFVEFISNLSSGFKEMIFSKILSKVNKTIDSMLKDNNLPEIFLTPRFTFNEFNENKEIKNYIYLTDVQDGRNNSNNIDISDEDLPF